MLLLHLNDQIINVISTERGLGSKQICLYGLDGIGSVRPNYTFALGSFARKVDPFARKIRLDNQKYFNEHNAYFI